MTPKKFQEPNINDPPSKDYNASPIAPEAVTRRYRKQLSKSCKAKSVKFVSKKILTNLPTRQNQTQKQKKLTGCERRTTERFFR